MKRIMGKIMMAVTACAVMVLGPLFPAAALDFSVTQITDNDMDDSVPRISKNGDIVWIGPGYDGFMDIYVYDGSTYVIKTLTNHASINQSPDINDNGDIAWKTWNLVEYDWNIMRYTKAANQILRISLPDETNPAIIRFDDNPEINNNRDIVYQSQVGGLDQEIMLYTSSTNTTIQITNNDLTDEAPRFNSNGDIVWMQSVLNSSDPNIYLRTGGTNTPLTASTSQRDPKINETGDIVWSGWDGVNYQIFYHVRSAGTTTKLTSTSSTLGNNGVQINADGKIAWVSDSATDDEIWFRSGLTGTNTNISSSSVRLDARPQINDLGWVTWQQDAMSTDTNNHIFVWDTISATQIITDSYNHRYPMLNNDNTVVWEGTGGAGTTRTDYELFMSPTGTCAFLSCNDGDNCTDDTCIQVTGCVYTPIVCNDNNACTTNLCTPETGCFYVQVPLDDGNACTKDLCNPTTGAISHTPIVCDDNNICTTDSCDTAIGCVTSPKCSDNNLCTTDTCNPTTGACSYPPVVCNDNNLCTDDSCNAGVCVFTHNNTSCPSTTGNSFTMLDTHSNVVGGTNDITFAWDGNTRTSVVPSGQSSNALLTSTCIYSSSFWKAHDLAVYSAGTYTIYSACPAGSPGCGLTSDPTGINCPVGNTCPPMTFTVKTGEIGIHMLFDWGGNTNIDVVNVLKPNAKFAPSPMASEGPYFCGSNSSCTVWGWMSYDWDGDGLNGGRMVDGPFPGFSPNFSYNKVLPVDLCCDAATRCNDNNECTIDTCNAATGACINTVRVCNDNSLCTVDTCVPTTPGGCVFTPKNCSDNNACTTDTCPDPATGVCLNTTKNCNDNNACTIDSCNPLFGCLNIPNTCNDNNACTADTCTDPLIGCVNTPTNNGSACNDNNICTAGEVCSNGVCTGTATVPASCNDNNICTTDGCTANACTHVVIVPASCNDNNICTTDGCSANACTYTATVPVSCNDNNVCTTETCTNNTCGYTNNALTCNDNNACTAGDACSNGICAGAKKNCSDNNACTSDTCPNPATGACVNTAITCIDNKLCTTDTCSTIFGCIFVPVTCNDNNICTTDSCNTATGACTYTATVPASCNDNNLCTTDTCANNACGHTSNTLACNDNNACTTRDACSGGVCAGGTATVCMNNGACNTSTGCPGVSTHGGNFTLLMTNGLIMGGTNDVKLTMNGDLQDAELFSNGTGTSNATITSDEPFGSWLWSARNVQVVGPGTYWVDLDGAGPGTDRFQVTIPANQIGAHLLFDWGSTDPGLAGACGKQNCDADVWIAWEYNKAFAVGKLFTGADNGITSSGPLDGSPNTTTAVWQLASVDLAGKIINAAGDTLTDLPVNGVPGIRVTDGSISGYSGYSVNINGMLTDLCADAATRCNDNNNCTVDACRVTTGECVNTAKNCSDNNKCTTDTCNTANGACVNTPVVIDDNNACTTDSCSLATGVITHTPKVCNDNNLCTTDTCNTTTGACVFTNNTVACDDNNICTVNDACSNGACAGAARVCYSGGVCDTVTGCPPVDTHGGNFSLMMAYGWPIGGTNDVKFWWDGNLQDEATFANGDGPINATLTSDEPFARWLWVAKNVQVVGPGTYWVYLDGAGIDPTRYEVTIPTGKIGAHLLLDWGSTEPGTAGYCGRLNCDADVWLAWDFNKAYAANRMYPGADNGITSNGPALNGLPFVLDGSPNKTASIWGLVSIELTGKLKDAAGNIIKTLPVDGVPGITMQDGTLAGFTANFNVMLIERCGDAATRCNDNNICTIDSCNVTTGACVNTAKNCNDSDGCTNDLCNPANAQCYHTPVVIDDNDACTTDSCNTRTGVITHTPNIICNDNNLCTTDTCNPATGACVFTSNTLACDDNNICTVNDACSSGACAGAARVCYSGGACDTATGCPPVDTQGNNFTLMMSFGFALGGTNDVKFWWDGILQDAAAFDNGNGLSNATISSDEPFSNWLWVAKNVQVVGPGTYWVYLDGAGIDPTRYEVTIPEGKIGAHLLLDWGSTEPGTAGYCGKQNCDADVWIAWDFNSAYAADKLFTGADNGITSNCPALDGLPCVKDGNANTTTTVWGLASVDLAGQLTDSGGNTLIDLPLDGVPGISMQDGTLVPHSVTFNVMLTPCADAAVRCNDNNVCTTDSCNAATGACVNTAIACPDLTEAALTSSQSVTNLLVNDQVTNQGTASAGAFNISYYLSADAVYSAGTDTYLGMRSVPSLAAGASNPASSTTQTIVAIPSVPATTYYMIAFADSGNTVIESTVNETNNTRSASVSITGIDLVPTVMTAIESGSTVTVNDTVKNQGSSSSGVTSTITYYLSINTTYESGTDIALASVSGGTGTCSRSVSALGAGLTSSSGNKACYKPTGAVTGQSYYVLVRDDSGSLVTEYNENNNVLATTGTISW